MLGRTYEGQTCSVARALEIVGERWTLLVLRDAFLGVRRFDDFQRSLGVARNVLTTRLGRLVEEGVLERVAYQQRPERFEYRLTEKGLGLWPVIVGLRHWGDEHYAEAGPPRLLEHRGCGGAVSVRLTCERCAAELGPRDVRTRPGPGAQAAA
jgi:DNA-binding HxlR family transcriptional regulator